MLNSYDFFCHSRAGGYRDDILLLNQCLPTKNATTLPCVYNTDSAYSTPLRVSTNNTINLTGGSEDNPFVNQNADGFRLPMVKEWGPASRWKGSSAISSEAYEYPACSGKWWTFGDFASGDPNPFSSGLFHHH
jgi:hypothetical protein